MPPSPPETRASLILRLPNAADVAAWEEFVAIYRPLVFNLAIRRGLQPTDADDLVQEVFAAVARQVGDWLDRSNRGPFRAWLLRIARNVAVDLLTRGPHGGTATGGDESQRLLADVAEPDRELSSEFDIEYRREVFRWAAQRARKTVADTTWQAFWRTHVDGEPIEAVARQLGIGIGNVYIARSRVMARLQEMVKRFEVRQ